MKKKNIACVLALFALASCAKAAEGSSSNPSAQPVDESAALTAFLTKLKANNCTILEKETGMADLTMSLYGNEGVYLDNGTAASFGLIVNKTQGVFDFTYSNNAVVLGQAESATASLSSVFYTPAEIAAAENDFTKTEGSLVYEVNAVDDAFPDLAYLIVGLAQIDTLYLDYGLVSGISLEIASDGNSGTFSFDYGSASETYTVTMAVSAIGTTNNDVFSAYLAAPSDAETRTAFTAETIAAGRAIFGDSVTLPFPTGLADALFRDDVSNDDNDDADYISFEEFGKDITPAYVNQLLAAGYAKVETTDIFGSALVYYEKSFKEETGNVGPSVIRVSASYDEASKTSSVTIDDYTYPKTIETTDVAKANEYLTTYNGKEATLPLLAESADITKAVTKDYAAVENKKFSLVADLSIAVEATAKTYGKAYLDALVAKGFAYATDDWSGDGYAELSKGTVSVTASTWTNDSDAFDGGLSIYWNDAATA
jgi:hypothetical protein